MILIIDNYDSFTYNLVHLVGTRVDEVRVVRNDVMTVDDVRRQAPDGIMISPGPGRPSEAGITEELIAVVGPEIPILGVCLGHQAIGEVYGADVTYAPTLMHGKTSEIHHQGAGIFRDVVSPFTATRYHSLVLAPDSIPDVIEVTAETADGVVMGLRHREYPVEGIQFHPESVLTSEGPRLIENWLSDVVARRTQRVV